MIKAELEYNPYLLETLIRFNGHKPRINSLVEKYEGKPLRDWIDKIPDIFSGEMNGYDFELEFTGTERDYQELRTAFERIGVGEDLVHIFHKNVLDGRIDKIKRLDELLEWLEGNRNSHFDYDSFKRDNDDIFGGMYPFVVINGRGMETSVFDRTDVSVELLDSVDELSRTDLTDTPILINVTGANENQLADMVKILIERDGVKDKQLFFTVKEPVSRTRVGRTLTDVGVDRPQIVSGVEDEAVIRYLELYPYSDYLYAALRALRNSADDLTKRLEEETRENAEANKEVYDKLESLENAIEKLKETQEHFENYDNDEIPGEWMETREQFLKSVMEWRAKRTLVKNEGEAWEYANDYYGDVSRAFAEFMKLIEGLFKAHIDDENRHFKEMYDGAARDDGFDPTNQMIRIPEFEAIPSFQAELMELKKEQYVDVKEGFIEMLFKDTNEECKEKVLETTFYLNGWREHVREIVDPLAERVIEECFDTVCGYEKQIISKYNLHLSDEIERIIAERRNVSSRLSEDEKQLQNDNDWIWTFEDKLRSIERY